MSTQEIANRLVELCRQGNWEGAQVELFSSDAESMEPPHSQGLQSVKGLDAIKEKGHQFQNMVEATHGGYVSDPVIAGNRFAVAMGADVTMKGQGRMNMEEIAVYDVKDGKIVREQFIF
jgi:hypothetical protein